MIVRILMSAVLIPLVLAAVFFLPSYLFLILTNLVLILAMGEYLKIVASWGSTGYWLTYALGAGMSWVWVYRPELLVPFLVLASFGTLTWAVAATKDMKIGFASASGNLMGILYIGIPLAILAAFQSRSPREVLLVLLAIWVADAAAYFAGKAFGKHKITPGISPNKSLEGYIAGLAGSTVTVLIFARFYLPHWPVATAIATGVLLGFFSTLGDLFESVLKRGAGIKDSSGLIPGHGGVLDRIDSLLFAYPTYYLISLFLPGSLP